LRVHRTKLSTQQRMGHSASQCHCCCCCCCCYSNVRQAKPHTLHQAVTVGNILLSSFSERYIVNAPLLSSHFCLSVSNTCELAVNRRLFAESTYTTRYSRSLIGLGCAKIIAKIFATVFSRWLLCRRGTKNRDCQPIYRFISKTIQNMAILTLEYYEERT